MRLTESRAHARPAPTPTMPPGLVELMEGLAKDVLKNNPENVYEFCAAHMQKLLEIRDGPTPPIKKLSLEQKIANAQEKIRQRNKTRQIQHVRKFSEHPNVQLDYEDKIPIKEAPIDTSAIQPVINKEKNIMKNEVEIFHEPKVTIATNDIYKVEPSDVVNEVFEVSQVEHEAKQSVSNVTQKFERSEGSLERVTEQAIESIISADTNETSDVQANVKSDNVADIDDHGKEIVDLVVKSTEHVENMPPNENIVEDQLNESEPTVSNTVVSVEENTDNGGPPEKEVIRDELNEVASTLLLASKTVTAFSNNVKTIAKEVAEEPEVYNKDINMDTQHEEILLKECANQIEPGKKLEDIIEEHKIMKEEPTDIQDDESGADKMSFKERVEDITRTDNGHIVERNRDKLLSKSDDLTDSTVEDFNINPRDTVLQTESSHDENQLLSATETKTSKTAISQVSAEGIELSDNQVRIEETTEKSTVDDSFPNKDESNDQEVNKNNKVNYKSEADIKITEVDEKLLEHGPVQCEKTVVKDNTTAHGNINVGIDRDSINESDELTDHTAVSGMDLETAAITIQKVFRTFLFSKSRASTLDDTVNESSLEEDLEKKDEPEYGLNANINKERRTLGISRMDTVLQTVNEEKSLSLSDESSMSSAATTIQAHVRGFLVRNRLASHKTASSSSLVNSDGQSTSLDGDVTEHKKTILNIHIVPERGHFISRDESLLTSIDLPLDNSPPSSINLHPLGYDKSERRKQLKREDAVQSISPPSNNSGKQSEEVDSVKETHTDRSDVDVKQEHGVASVNSQDKTNDADTESCETTLTISSTAETVVDADTYNPREVLSSPEHNVESDNKHHEVLTSSDEMDVVTPSTTAAKTPPVDSENDDKPKLVHSGEFHDIVVQTQVKRSEASVVREFKNVLVYFLLWDKT